MNSRELSVWPAPGSSLGKPFPVLQVNKFFFPHGGSETVMFLTRELLADRGHKVIDFAMRDERNAPSQYQQYFSAPRSYASGQGGTVRRALDGAAATYSWSARRSLRRLIRQHRPAVAHLHLVYHQLTLSVVDELAAQGIPIVMTAHDYKVACPAYTLFRDGEPCSLCISGPQLGVVRHRCIKGSLAASALAWIEAETARRRHLYQKVGQWIAPSRFSAGILTAAGLDRDRISVIPNFLPDREFQSGQSESGDADPRFVYAGRLEPAKGVEDLLAVYEQSAGELGTLVIASAGGSLTDAAMATAGRSPHIEYLGRLPRDEVSSLLRSARACVLPSRWYENNPMAVLEARAAGTAVICSDRGGLPEMVEHLRDGLIVRAGDRLGLAEAIARLAHDPELARTLGAAGNARARRDNRADAHYRALLRVYDLALANPIPHDPSTAEPGREVTKP